jgi:hypothetical protein
VDLSLDAPLGQVLHQPVSLRMADHEGMVDGPHALLFGLRQRQLGHASECLAIERRVSPPNLGPLFDPIQLDRQEGGLQGIEPRVVRPELARVAIPQPVVSGLPEPTCEIPVLRDDGPGVTAGAEILERVKTEARESSEPTNPLTVVLGPDRLCAILDDLEAPALSERSDGSDARGSTRQVDRQDGPRPGSDATFEVFRVQIVVRTDVGESRCRTGQGNCGGRSKKGVGRCQHLVATPDSEGPEGEGEGRRARTDPDREGHARNCCNGLLQALHLPAEYERSGRKDPPGRIQELGLEPTVLRA